MEYVGFTIGFFLIHLGAYLVAGVIAQRFFTRGFYEGEQAVFAPFLRDMSKPDESARVTRRLLPAQLVRAVLMSVVLYPVLGALGDMSIGLRFAFLAGLMFVYADLASAVPFANTIEGWVYMKKRFVERRVFLRVQAEAVVYSLLFGGLAAWLLFL